MQMPNVPDAIDRAAFNAALERLGIDVKRLRSVHIDIRGMELEYLATDDEGRLIGVGGDAGTVRVQVPIIDIVKRPGLTDTEREADQQAALARAGGGSMPPANLDEDSIPVKLSNGYWHAPGIPDDVVEALNQSSGTPPRRD